MLGDSKKRSIKSINFANSFKLFVKLSLCLGLLACTGAAVNGGGGLPTGIGDTANQADGTLASQSGYQEMSGGCAQDWALHFAGESSDSTYWLIRSSSVPTYFPKVTVGKIEGDGAEFKACTDCQGRALRVVDLGEAPGDVGLLSQYKMQFIQWVIALSHDSWDPALLPAARYREYLVSASGEADISGLEMLQDHLYYFLVSKQAKTPVSTPTAFASIEEFNAMSHCSKDPADPSPFFALRLAHVLEKEPVELHMTGPLPTGGDEDSNEDSDHPILQIDAPTSIHKVE